MSSSGKGQSGDFPPQPDNDVGSEDSPEDFEDEVTQLVAEDSLGKDDAEKRCKEMEDKFLRTYADFENFRKRVAKEKEDIAFHASEKLLKEFLEVKDHLELALEHSKDAADAKGLREGVLLTLKQLEKFLEKNGVKEISPLGEPFDPAFHEAIHQEKSVEYKPGAIVHVYQKGYLYRDKLLRPARVTVAA